MTYDHHRVALITGSAKRVGATLARTLHGYGFRVLIHYHQSAQAAQALCKELNQLRKNSANTIQADLQDTIQATRLIDAAVQCWGQLDVLINNAARFQATRLDQVKLSEWQATLNSNLSSPFFISLAAHPHLYRTKGCIINLTDIRATQPLKDYAPYCISKAGLVMMTKALAKEWAPAIRVNAIAPGVVLWPDDTSAEADTIQKKIISRTPLKRAGTPMDIAKTAIFLIQEAPYITGQVIPVDGGRSLAY